MPERPSFRQWQIWRTDWKNNQGGTGRRRVLLIADDSECADAETLHCAGISTDKDNKRAGVLRTWIRKKDSPELFALTGLSEDCFAFTDDIQAVPRAELTEYAGVLPRYWHEDFARKLLASGRAKLRQ